MLLLREYKLIESEDIKNLLFEEDIEDLDLEGLIYVVIDNDELIGVSKVEKEDEKFILKYLVIKHDRRGDNLGEALLRALVSKLDNQGVDRIYYKYNSDYLINKGFYLNENNRLELNIVKFFKNGCECSGECNV